MDDRYCSIPRKNLAALVARVLLGLGASTSGNGNRSKPVTGQQANNAFGSTHRFSGSVLLVDDGVRTVYAIARYRGGFFDLIPMDIGMPGMDGYTATRLLEQEKRCRIPIIVPSAHARKGGREQCLDTGVDEYLARRVSRDALLSMLARWLPSTDGPNDLLRNVLR